MNRCDVRASALVLALIASTLAVSLPSAASAQEIVQRNFPRNALRGEIVLLDSGNAVLNGKLQVGLAPGLKFRGPDNLLVMTGAALGQKFVANYTVDTYGLINNLWALRPDEAQRLWPKTEQEAAAWGFDPVAQIWVKP